MALALRSLNGLLGDVVGQHFEFGALEREFEYFRQDRVDDLMIDPGDRHVWASVVGSRRRPYRVVVSVDPGPPCGSAGNAPALWA
jgi:hypothetical protein